MARGSHTTEVSGIRLSTEDAKVVPIGHWKGSTYLCKPCHRLSERFSQQFNPSCFPAFVNELPEIQRPSTIRLLGSCALCDMVSDVARLRKAWLDSWGSSQQATASLWCVSMLEEEERIKAISSWDDRDSSYKAKAFDLHYPNPQRWREPQWHGNWTSHHPTGLITPAMVITPRLFEDRASPDCGARLLDRARVDFKVVKNWITECLTCYDDCLGQLIRKPHEIKYTALSYVWGATSRVTARNLPALDLFNDPSTPRTIKDAMAVTLELDYRFLWVDRFSASGKDAKSGLPGAGTSPLIVRDKQPAVKFGRYTLTTTLPEINIEVAKSKWATRAWTYQEAILSS
ncbi:uncharacterized protein PAC_14316 [Phialocephala subalpina]|uniref:Heterokaryon incompatibility domain-containing protein n=1 Tax=Phialocephala subalpina TaxID=576137 RepID=A0A1L7XHD2_9HELO|nr:uncharacterized protein PAC_14316 [Phialocephala subalpina]